MPSATKVTTRKRGRPKSENPFTNRRMVNLTEGDGRRLNRLLREEGYDGDADLLRQLVTRLLDEKGIEDPGPDSPLAEPPAHHLRRKRTAAPDQKTPDQLTLVA